MRRLVLVTTCVAVVIAAGIGVLAEDANDVAAGGNSFKDVERVDVVDDQRRQERIFAFYTTTSVKRLATTTITAISTCLSILAAAPACTGRKKRSLFSDLA